MYVGRLGLYRLLASTLWAASLAACHAPPRAVSPPQTRVDFHAVADNSLPHYAEDTTTGVISPIGLLANAAPAYPASLLQQRLPPVEIRALLIVGADGRVHEVRVSPAIGDDAPREVFLRAVVATTMSWHFEPLRITRWEDQPDGSTKRVADTPAPFSQIYVFRFEVRDGKPVVSSGATR